MKKLIVFWISFVIILVFSSKQMSCLAEVNEQTCEVSLSVVAKEKYVPVPSDIPITVEIVANTENAPMPTQTVITVFSSLGEYFFSPIQFTEVGNYEYQIYQCGYESEETIFFDNVIYKVIVSVFYNDFGELLPEVTIIRSDSETKATSIIFENEYVVSPITITNETTTSSTISNTTAVFKSTQTTTTAVSSDIPTSETTEKKTIPKIILEILIPQTGDFTTDRIFILILAVCIMAISVVFKKH